ncbi:MAG: hypothetical protein NTX91_03265 [candidate division SR1 bacterium]|nr:hypothetical protein [candidate division SR1 bacterium]
MKKIGLLILGLTPLLLVGCGKAPAVIDTVVFTGAGYDTSSLFVVGTSQPSENTAYGLVIADNVKNIVTSVGGNLDALNCQPGAHVTADSVIAQIGASTDIATQNSQIQYLSLQQQIDNMQKIISLTENNFGVQEDILTKQKENNAYLMDNLQQSKDLNANDMKLSVKSLENQQNALEDTQNRDMDKMDMSIQNMRDQLDIAISDALKKVNDIFNSSTYGALVGTNNSSLKSKVLDQYQNLRDRYQTIQDISDEDFSTYLSHLSLMLKNAALAMAASTASQTLPQTAAAGVSIDGLYTSYLGLSTSMVASKSSYDSLLASAVSLKNADNLQLDTIDTSIESLSNNKSELSRIGSDTQIANMTLAQASVMSQLASLDNTKAIQLATLNSQLLTLQQNEAMLGNNLQGETLLAGVNGVIKTKSVVEGNKVNPSTMICQIVPDGDQNLKIQIYSYTRIALGQAISFYRGNDLLGNGKIIYELPYKDAATQNYIYEMVGTSLPVLDGEKVLVKFTAAQGNGQLWIPLPYIIPRLEGNYVKKLVNGTPQETAVTLGEINGSVVQVMSGLQVNDQIVY